MQRQLIYGTASLHRLPTSGQRQRVIAAAYDAGIRAFDLAPAYGNGVNELEVGIALQGKRTDLDLNTKYGIPIAVYGAASRHAFAVRRLADRLTGRSARAYRQRDFSPRALETSLHESLRRLRTDHVDGLFVHEPIGPLSPAALEDIVACGERMKAEGKIKTLGVAGPLRSVAFCGSLAGMDVVQTRYADLPDLPPAVAGKPVILYGVHEAYRAAKGTDFRQFVRRILAVPERPRVIVASRRLETIRSFGEILT